MNEKLKFSWGHIIAFLALIAVSYTSFVGFTYLTNGNFTFALIGMAFTDVVFIVFFIGAQQMKASGVKMSRKIIWERIFIFGSPVIFLIGMISISHFFTVQSRNDDIVEKFQNSINSSKQLFTDYEEYADERIGIYEKKLTNIIANKRNFPRVYKEAGFEDSKATIQRDNMVETLRLQLLSQNYDSLKRVANKWIDDASQGASTWNVFLLGNTREIKEALNNWENQLKSFSSKEMSNEAFDGEVKQFHSDSAQKAIAGIDNLTESFTSQRFPTLAAIIFGIVIYLMLLFPYFLQDRHTKSIFTLTGTIEFHENKKSKFEKLQHEVPKHFDENSSDKLELNSEEVNDYPTF